jgi:malonate-semialdehyde dehydrogenase (acetylating)/methylmalonate-semialdehyde dehydrogenase
MTEVVAAPKGRETQELRRISHWIDARSVEGGSGRSGQVWNPATGEQQAEVDFASLEEIDAAVGAARKAFPDWRSTSLSRRAELFFRIRKLFDEHRTNLARLLTLERGKVLSDALGEVARGLEVSDFACGIPTLLTGEFS